VSHTSARRAYNRIAGLIVLAAILAAGSIAGTASAAASAGGSQQTDVPTAGSGSGPDGGSGASGAVGGTQFTEKPKLLGLQCQTRCGTTTASTKVVSIRDTGVLKVRGRHLDGVATVVFLGQPGHYDDTPVAPISADVRSLTITVPRQATSGHVILVDRVGRRTTPSSGIVRVMHDSTGLPGASDKLIWPVHGPITSPFCERRAWEACHPGMDIGVPSGTPIHAAAAGIVSLMAPEGGYGNFTCIRHVRLTTCYAHQSRFATHYGAQVKQGQIVGYSGCTGRCYGAHLHFEVRKGTSPSSPVTNPINYLPGR
jgi:Peptidase family M23